MKTREFARKVQSYTMSRDLSSTTPRWNRPKYGSGLWRGNGASSVANSDKRPIAGFVTGDFNALRADGYIFARSPEDSAESERCNAFLRKRAVHDNQAFNFDVRNPSGSARAQII